MKIGVPKEIKPQENRIGLTPESVKTLVSEGHEELLKTMVVLKQVLKMSNTLVSVLKLQTVLLIFLMMRKL